MAGIVRAADRVAVWHQAADEDPWANADHGDASPGEDDLPTSTPPTGGSPPAQAGGQPAATKIPNSNKFKLPAKNLKKLLDTVEGSNFSAHGHPAVKAWFDAHPAFAKSYLKPQYQGGLREALGEQNYQKLTQHMPDEHYQALHTTVQVAAPKSKKWTSPVSNLKNKLNALVVSPGLEPKKELALWFQGHPSFHPYLQPQYQQAMKADLGPTLYDYMTQHMPAEHHQALTGKKPQATPEPEQQQSQSLGEKLQAVGGHFYAPAWDKLHQEKPEKAKESLENVIKGLGFHGSQLKALQDIYDEHFGQQPTDADDIGAIKQEMPGPTGPHHNQYTDPSQLEKNRAKATPEPKSSPDADDISAIKAEVPEQSPGGDQIQLLQPKGFQSPQVQHPALAQGLAKIFPNSKADFSSMSDADLKTTMEQWIKHLPKTQGYEGHVPQIKELYDQYFGQGAPKLPQPEFTVNPEENLGPEGEPLEQQPAHAKTFGEMAQSLWPEAFTNPAELDKLPPEQQQKLLNAWSQPGNHPTPEQLAAMAEFKKDDPDADDINAIKAEMPDVLGEKKWTTPDNTIPSNSGSPSLNDLNDYQQWAPGAEEWLHQKFPGMGQGALDLIPAYLEEGEEGPSWEKLNEEWGKHQQGQPQDADDINAIKAEMPSATSEIDPQAFADAYKKLFPVAADGSFAAYSPDQIKHQLQTWMGYPGFGTTETDIKVQQLWDQFVGGGSSKGTAFDPKSSAGEHPFEDAFKQVFSGDLKDYVANPADKAEIQEMLKGWASTSASGGQVQQGAQKLLDTYFGGGQAQADSGKPTLGWMQKHYPSTLDWDQAKLDKWYAKQKEKGTHNWGQAMDAWVHDDYDDKDKYPATQPVSAQPAQPQFVPGKSGPPSKEQLLALGFSENHAAAIANQTPEKFWANVGVVGANAEDYKGANWGKLYDLVTSNQAPAVTPEPENPEFDWGKFAPEFKSVFPSSSWADQGDPGGQDPAAKIQGQLENSLSNPEWAASPKTQQIKDLYQKWFPQQYAQFMGGQAPADQPATDQPDIEAINQAKENLPPPEPPKPFKSQTPQPDDINHWAQNKPLSEAGWKNFSTWWGNNKLTTDQETGLYKTWFNKDTTPEAANAWFQAMFEHQAEPSEGDLDLTEGSPGWAHAPWAFGAKADKEWPVFQAWAAKHPGIPKGSTIKQKVAIWNSLSATDKKGFADEYFPKGGVDTKGVVDALAKAYPDSDFSDWSKLSQPQLEKSMHGLATSGSYGPATAIYNQFYGGDVPMPPEPEPGKAKPKAKSVPVIPQEALPQWVKNGYGSNLGVSDSPTGAKKYTDFYRWADSIGKGEAVSNPKSTGNSYPSALMNLYNKIPEHLQLQLGAMPTMPWSNEEGFNSWLDGQPKAKDEVKAIYPDTETEKYWYDSGSNSKSVIEGYLKDETDPQKKQALLGIYQKWFGAGKPTLAEELKKAVPDGTDWDKYLQTHSPDDAAKLIKKKLKAESDPNKFIHLANIWSKYFPGPAGHKQVGQVLGKNSKGGLSLSSNDLGALYNWKVHGEPGDSLNNYYGIGADESPYYQEQKGLPKGKHPLFFGWTPPGDLDTSYTPDPAMLAQKGAAGAIYTAPPEGPKGKATQELLERAKKWEPATYSPASFKTDYQKVFPNGEDFKKQFPNWDWQHSALSQASPTREKAKAEINGMLHEDLPFWQHQKLEQIYDKYFRDAEFSEKDKATLNSSAFQNWFAKAPKDYQEITKSQPGLALDDYQEFMGGGSTYSPMPEGDGKQTQYDMTPFGNLPYTKPGQPHNIFQGPGADKPYMKNYDPSKAYESIHNDPEASKWPGFTKNPMRPGDRQKLVKTPDLPPDSTGQLEIPLPAGQSWAHEGRPVELHRWMGLNLADEKAYYDQNPPKPPPEQMKKVQPQQYTKKQREYEKELHRKFLFDQLRYRFLGSQKGDRDAVPDLFSTAEDERREKGVELPKEWQNDAPKGPTGMFDFQKWAEENNVPKEQIYDLAKKWGADDPHKYGPAPMSEGPWTKGMDLNRGAQSDPEFANLLLDYLESTDYYKAGWGYAPPGSLGDHWSISNTGGKGFASGDFNVLISGDWYGQGENPDTAHATVGFGPSGEQEINLAQRAPVHVKRVRFVAPGHGIDEQHDLVVKPHWRFASACPPPQTRIEMLPRLASLWGVVDPERYGLVHLADLDAGNDDPSLFLAPQGPRGAAPAVQPIPSQDKYWEGLPAPSTMDAYSESECPEGSVFDYVTNQCDSSTCPPGYYYDPVHQICTHFPPHACPPGYIYNPIHDICQVVPWIPGQEDRAYAEISDRENAMVKAQEER